MRAGAWVLALTPESIFGGFIRYPLTLPGFSVFRPDFFVFCLCVLLSLLGYVNRAGAGFGTCQNAA
jgi:hypothetical protein